MPSRGSSSFRKACLTGMILLAAAGSALAQDEAYRLGIMDKLKVRVAEWQPAEGTIRDWSVIGGDYTVGPRGVISLSFVGEMSAAGKTTSEIEIGRAHV